MKVKDIINVALSGLFILVFSLICFFYETPAYSESERRELAKMPEITLESIVSGEFSKEFESYTTDRFPFRDFFRSVKAKVRYDLFGQIENNKIYFKDGHISKLDYVKSEPMLEYARDLFLKINEQYLKESNKVYFAMVPDKNMYLADIKLDYAEIEAYFKNELPFENISIKELLDENDYYYTDSHWRQNKITDIAKEILQKMGVELETTYKENTLDIPFKGVWLGQSALSAEPDKITYLTNDAIDKYNVYLLNDYGKWVRSTTYNFEKASGKDGYEFFLSGTQAVVVVDNPTNTSGKTLVVFRDSFGSSMGPLLAEGYSRTVFIDLRYIDSSLLGNIPGVSFKNADVLFMYSTLLLNSSLGMK